MQFSSHCLQKEMPFSLDGGPVSWPLGRLTTTTFLSFPLDKRVLIFCFDFSTSTNSSGGCFLAPSSGLGGSSDVVVAAVELFFLDLATLDFTVSLLWFLFGRLGLVVSLTATNKMTSMPSPPTSFPEGFFLGFGCPRHYVSRGELNDLMVLLVDGLEDGLLYVVCVRNVGWLGCDIIHVVN